MVLNNVHFVLKLFSGRGVKENSNRDDHPWFVANPGSGNYLRSHH